MWDRIEPVRPDRGLSRVPPVPRVRRDERRGEEGREREERPPERRPEPGTDDEAPATGQVDLRA
jgi:hypothetical protein